MKKQEFTALQLLEEQTRLTCKWKEELTKTSDAYEQVNDSLRTDLKNSYEENQHWREEIHKSKLLRQ